MELVTMEAAGNDLKKYGICVVVVVMVNQPLVRSESAALILMTIWNRMNTLLNMNENFNQSEVASLTP